MEWYRKMNVYEKRPSEECFEKTKKPPIKVKWIDHNTGDRQNVNVGSRLVAKQINTGKEEGLFAAAPPLEALRHPQNAAHAEVLEQDTSSSGSEFGRGRIGCSERESRSSRDDVVVEGRR